MKTTTLKITIAATIILAAGLGMAEDPGCAVRIYRLGEASAKEGDTINFYGFFPGMSRHDAQFLAERFDLDGNECYIHADAAYMGGCYESEWHDESSRNLWRKSSNYVSYTRRFRLCASKENRKSR